MQGETRQMRYFRMVFYVVALAAVVVGPAVAQTPPTTITGSGGTVTTESNVRVTTGSNAVFHIFNSDNAELLRLQSNGFVGIGTAAPNRKLDISYGGDGITFGQPTDNTQAIQTYIDNHWADRAAYVNGCCNGLLIQPDVGWVAIGTSNPTGAYKLEVAGQIFSSTGGYRFPDNTVQTTAVPVTSWTRTGSGGQFILSTPDRVGIGTTTPNGMLDVQSAGDGIVFWKPTDNVQSIQTYIDGQWTNRSTYAGGCCNLLVLEPDAGTVAIGTMSADTTKKLYVSGNAHFTGTVSAGIIHANYQDLAEWVPASDDLEAGTVVVLDTRTDNTVKASARPYDTSVAGVISTQPGIALGVAGADKELVATTGRVKVKVDDTNGPILIGDLLVTSNKPGYAMKSVPIEVAGIAMHRPGTIVGKALEPLAGGEGEILVLLSMQ